MYNQWIYDQKSVIHEIYKEFKMLLVLEYVFKYVQHTVIDATVVM